MYRVNKTTVVAPVEAILRQVWGHNGYLRRAHTARVETFVQVAVAILLAGDAYAGEIVCSTCTRMCFDL